MRSNRWSFVLILLGALFVLVAPGIVFAEEGRSFGEAESLDESAGGLRSISLEEALRLARFQSHQIRIGTLELDKAELARSEARWGRLPSVSLEGQYTNNIRTPAIVLPEDSPFGGGILRTGSRHNFQGSLQASVSIYNAQLNRNIELREVLLSLERTLLEATEQEVALEVQRAYVNALLAREIRDVVVASFESLERNFRFVEGMYRVGAVPEYDLIRAEVQYRNLEPEIQGAKDQVEGTLNYLKLLVGIDLQEEIALSETLEAIFNEKAGTGFEGDFSRNRDLLQVAGQERVVDVQRALEEATYLPTVAAFGNFTYQGSGDELDVWNHQWFSTAVVGLSVSVPLIQGGRRQRVDQARVEARQVQMQREFLLRSLRSQYETTSRRLETLEESIDAQRRNVGQAERGYEIARRSYEQGVHSLIDVNDAEAALRDARRNYTTTMADYLGALFDVMDLLGVSELNEARPRRELNHEE